MNRSIRWGVLGYARIASTQVIPAMAEAQNAVPYAIASRSAEKLKEAKEAFGFEKTYEGYEALLSDPNVDAVYIPLPNALHKEWTIKAARAGKHVLCEKPLALNEKDCREMIAVCEECGVQLMEAFMYRLSTRTRKLEALLESGVIGEVRHIHSSFRFVLNRDSIKMQEGLGGGSLWDVGCYPVNIIGMVMKDMPVACTAQKVMNNGVDISFAATLKYKNGVICTLSSGFNSSSALLTEIDGTAGSIVVRDSFLETDTPILLVKDGVFTEIEVEPCKRYVLEIEDFSKAVQTGGRPALSLEEAARNNGLMEMLLKKAEEV